MSDGSRSGVNWMRAWVPSMVLARPGQHRLARAGEVLEQQVALGDQAGQRQPDDVALAEHRLGDVVGDQVEGVAEPGTSAAVAAAGDSVAAVGGVMTAAVVGTGWVTGWATGWVTGWATGWVAGSEDMSVIVGPPRQH